MRLSVLFLFGDLSLILLTLSCSEPKGADTGTIIVGLTSELRVGVDIDRLHVVMRASGNVVNDSVLPDESGPLALPAEFAFTDLAGGTAVEIVFEAFQMGNTTTPLVVRTASTEVVAGSTLLLRVRLDSACAITPDHSGCALPETCLGGACGNAHIDVRQLEPYAPDWASYEPDICKPPGGGAPIVIVGQGQGDYLPLNDLEVAQVEAGPQGGHHIWIAIRMKNLRQSGSITSVGGTVPELQQTITPLNVIFTFNPDEGGFCKLAGLRFQLDETTDIHDLLGKVVNVQVQVKDRDQAIGTGERRVTLSTTIL